jgi:hypothetical protein
MNQNEGRRGPSPALLLLIPAALIIAKGARRRRAMWASGGGYGPHGGHGPRGRFGGFDSEGRQGFRLPPKIESALDAWHTRAHEATLSNEATKGDAATA